MPFKNMTTPTVTEGGVDTRQGREGFANEWEQAEAQQAYEKDNPNERDDAKGGMHSDPIEWPEVGGRKSFKVR